MKKPLDKCCNGCDAPPKPPSWVLCASCLGVLDDKMQRLGIPCQPPSREVRREAMEVQGVRARFSRARSRAYLARL